MTRSGGAFFRSLFLGVPVLGLLAGIGLPPTMVRAAEQRILHAERPATNRMVVTTYSAGDREYDKDLIATSTDYFDPSDIRRKTVIRYRDEFQEKEGISSVVNYYGAGGRVAVSERFFDERMVAKFGVIRSMSFPGEQMFDIRVENFYSDAFSATNGFSYAVFHYTTTNSRKLSEERYYTPSAMLRNEIARVILRYGPGGGASSQEIEFTGINAFRTGIDRSITVLDERERPVRRDDVYSDLAAMEKGIDRVVHYFDANGVGTRSETVYNRNAVVQAGVVKDSTVFDGNGVKTATEQVFKDDFAASNGVSRVETRFLDGEKIAEQEKFTTPDFALKFGPSRIIHYFDKRGVETNVTFFDAGGKVLRVIRGASGQ